MDVFISQASWKNPNPGLTLVYCDVIEGVMHGLEKNDLFMREPIMNLPSPCGEKFLNRIKEGRVWGKYRVVN